LAVEIDVALRAAAAIAGAAALGQVISRRFPIPLPLLLLAAGLLLGRDGLNVVRTHELEEFVQFIVVIAVALIVFEGGTALRLTSLRTLAPVVRNVVLLGLLVTPTVGAVAAWLFLDFDWRMAFLFGALVSVTGPSVITPLLRSFRVDDRLRDILASEGVIIDPLGALLTLFLLQIALAGTFDPAGPTWWVIERLLIGLAIGAAGAFLVWALSRLVKRLSGREMALIVIGAAVAAFAVAESFAHESGLVAMVLMAIAIGNIRLPQRERVDDLQESVTVWLIASVYVLLAAGISIDALIGLWPEGLIVVAVLVFIGRPLLIMLASIRSGLNWREQAFLSAVAPRGVVAASLAGVVAVEATSLIGGDASRLVAMVFVVILLTIGIQSVYAGILARVLGVQPMTTVVAGAGEVGRRIATLLAGSGKPVLVVETDQEAVMRAREEGLEVFIGDISDSAVLEKVRLHEAKALILATPDDARNLLAAQLARSKFNCETVFVRVNDAENLEAFQKLGVVPVSQSEAVASELARMVAGPIFQDVLAQVAEDVSVARVVVTAASAQCEIQAIPELRGTLVVLVTRGRDSVIPNGRTELRLGDIVTVFGSLQCLAAARGGLSVVPEPEPIIS
tara:strand:- start:13034 stop:14899 length:1866 start_codon:yes stop_codon:yes gene_type:complete